MEPGFLDLLRSRTADIHDRWESLLGSESLDLLWNDDTLAQLIPFTIACVVLEVARRALMPRSPVTPPPCRCGRSPLESFFWAGEQAFKEVVVLLPPMRGRKRRPVDELDLVVSSLRQVAQSHIAHHRSAGSPGDGQRRYEDFPLRHTSWRRR